MVSRRLIVQQDFIVQGWQPASQPHASADTTAQRVQSPLPSAREATTVAIKLRRGRHATPDTTVLLDRAPKRYATAVTGARRAQPACRCAPRPFTVRILARAPILSVQLAITAQPVACVRLKTVRKVPTLDLNLLENSFAPHARQDTTAKLLCSRLSALQDASALLAPQLRLLALQVRIAPSALLPRSRARPATTARKGLTRTPSARRDQRLLQGRRHWETVIILDDCFCRWRRRKLVPFWRPLRNLSEQVGGGRRMCL